MKAQNRLPATLVKRSDPVSVIGGEVGMAHPTGFEPVIPSFVDWCLIQFGHGCVVGIMLKIRVKNNRLVFLEYSSPFVLKCQGQTFR